MVPVLDQQHKAMGWLMVFADATEERQLAQAREDLSRMVVHDLRGPLTAISASMKLLTEMVPTTDVLGGMVRKTTDASQRAVRKLLGLVNSLLDIAKMESGNMVLERAPHSLRPLADSVRAELEPLAEELSIRMEVQIPEHLPSLFIDSEKVERVLLNLVDNALKFSPEDGLIQIRARTNGAGHVRVEIVDGGPGVPDDFKARIFDRFQQLDPTRSHRRGTGLGLTFCRLTVESHGGRIWIEDNPTGGSIFAFTLPTTQTAAPFVTDSD
jgi:signal transduction histidine kinase